MRASIGVCVFEQPERLLETLDQLNKVTGPNTDDVHDICIIADNPDDVTLAALDSFRSFPVCSLEGDGGGAAALNELARYSQADVIVLLESGALPGPRWLE